jgi:hypothetical protein
LCKWQAKQTFGMKATRLLRKLLLLSPAEWADLLRAQSQLLRAGWQVRLRRTGDLTEKASAATRADDGRMQRAGIPAAPTRTPLTDKERIRVEELVTAIERVADHGIYRPLCLVRSIALRNLLASQRIPGAGVRVGVRKDKSGLLAHAWVELDGRVIGDRPSHVRKFAIMDELGVRSPE